ncbi:oxaloacetate decarboxylase subunit gamma [Idiomarina sp. HP20-50]|uniref:oxaloacetate decarboxylase subunit gamma n=1 Tax=Idiomarina sp. HP20-50 TaxID=3070813 RepID=UPI00294B8102|nr:oxaloacetate decarboxylase subunit gamma [Idiomarina sp. HP20-50]MDV6317077.1 oxaloacetate decarboxylase subunit gamma [Idiomarina sp. HP20-50]
MSELLSQAAQLMLVGMGAVIIFLFLLTVAMSVMKRLIPTPEVVTSRQPSGEGKSADAESPALLAAISAAVHQYRHGKKVANNKEKS